VQIWQPRTKESRAGTLANPQGNPNSCVRLQRINFISPSLHTRHQLYTNIQRTRQTTRQTSGQTHKRQPNRTQRNPSVNTMSVLDTAAMSTTDPNVGSVLLRPTMRDLETINRAPLVTSKHV
jgi:hypothetical protein